MGSEFNSDPDPNYFQKPKKHLRKTLVKLKPKSKELLTKTSSSAPKFMTFFLIQDINWDPDPAKPVRVVRNPDPKHWMGR